MRKFSLVLANFPFSDEFWWLKPEQQADDKKKKDKLKKEIFGKEGYKDPFGRFGRGTAFKAPPAGYGDYAFILHILASLTDDGRAGIVCPQGVLFRGQPEVEEETGEFDDDGNPIIKRRKADDEHLIRKALLESRLIDAVISCRSTCSTARVFRPACSSCASSARRSGTTRCCWSMRPGTTASSPTKTNCAHRT